MSWICCQLGAREHYAIPRALHRRETLHRLITDAWVPSRSLTGRIVRGPATAGKLRSEVRGRWSALGDRFDQELTGVRVTAFTASLFQFELRARLGRLHGWDRTMARNEWFQRKAVGWLQRNAKTLKPEKLAVFAYSYAALELFRYAKERSWRTVLGQIDPGPVEEEIVVREAGRETVLGARWQRAPAKYWSDWREECELADCIMVNSEWSKRALEEGGISTDKIRIIPLVYEPATEAKAFSRSYPTAFNQQRPLRVLFLGQINLRKGVARLLKAIRLLENEPIEFQFVGPLQIAVPRDLQSHPRIRWFGAVSRREVGAFYRNADVLIFPTLSDGFGLTQLEAQAWSLPVIASRFCGEVVEDGRNGLLLEELTAEAIASALLRCVRNPEMLAELAQHACDLKRFSLAKLGEALLEVVRL